MGLASATTTQIPDEADGKVDEKVLGVPMRFLVPLNREGGFLIELKARKGGTVLCGVEILPER